MRNSINYAIAAGFGFILLGMYAAFAEPMKCTAEEKTCNTNCMKFARTAISTCIDSCRASRLICLRTGCWDTGTSRYCGLMKQ